MDRETLKEYTRRFCEGCSNTVWDNSPATECGQCLEDFADAIIRLATPTPSTDFTEVYNNRGTDYLLFDKNERQWFVGWCAYESDSFYRTTHDLDKDEYLEPSYWLPLPDAPNV